MVLQAYAHVFAVVSIVLEVLFVGILAGEYRARRSKLTAMLLGGFLSGLGWIVFTYINLAWLNDANAELASVVGMVANLCGNISFIFLAVFFRSLLYPKTDMRQLTIFALLTGIVAGIRYAAIQMALSGDFDRYAEIRSASTPFNLLILAYFTASLTMDYRKMMREDLTPAQVTQVRLFYFPLLITQILGMFIVALATPSLLGLDFLATGFVTSAAGIFFLAGSFLRDQRISSLFKDRTYLVLVASRGGKLKFSRNFYSEDKRQPILLSGLMSAIAHLVNSLYDFPLEPQTVRFNNGFIQFQMHKEFFILVFSKNESTLIKESLQKFYTGILRKYDGNLSRVMNDMTLLDLEDTFEKVFYYLQPLNIPVELPPF